MLGKLDAKNLILPSRPGLDARGAQETVTTLQQAGTVIEVIHCDVSDLQALTASVDGCTSSMAPIRGVF